MGSFAWEKRRRRLAKRLKQADVPALLVTSPANVTYLTGFTGHDSYLLVVGNRCLIISDTRYAIQIGEECPDVEAVIRDSGMRMHDAVGGSAKKLGVTRLGCEAASTSHAVWESLRTGIEGIELAAVDGTVEQLRQVKDKQEITVIREAVRQAERGFGLIRQAMVPDMTEQDVALELEQAMRRFGAVGVGFEIIVGVGARAALPHGRPGSTRLGEAPFVLIDWGACHASGYRSDLTRVLTTGKIPTKLEKIYRVVAEAKQAAIDQIRPGVSGKQVDAAARKVIADAGFGKRFGHGLGHGFGLEIHEQPRLSPLADCTLEAGMVITVEPGIYLPDFGGVRLEDDVLVTDDGCEVLTSLPCDLDWAATVISA